ncbi:hypothetical protein JTE90_007369 [Oedothorax gibbosus]|uniref:RING-type domain-containing protein n=1 Tax=Oedothorax gibbosus TaxID=931172 RepID=A0AAV6U658_9ARAC|nr:hypothetical protein JTE90_007369 [Oedothorax gibbosus]
MVKTLACQFVSDEYCIKFAIGNVCAYSSNTMDWVHCNNCFLLPDPEKSFLLTSCGHIYCGDCEEQCARGKCKLCGNACSTITISSSMKADVQIYFTDPDDLLKKKLREVYQVSEFQKSHRARLMTHYKKQLKKFKTVKEEFRKLLKNLKDIDSERKRLFLENDALKKYIGMQRCINPTSSSLSHRHEKGHSRSSFENNSPQSNLESVLSKFIEKFNDSKASVTQRMSVISPPRNGKLGVIAETPSPSATLTKLNLNASYSKESKSLSGNYDTLSTPGSNYSISRSTFVTPVSNTPSPIGSYCSPSDQHLKLKRDPRKKLVVHPFSPDD